MGLHRWALLAGVACGGAASAQSSRTPAALAGGSAPAPVVSPPVRAQAPSTDTVLVMKTAGQPDRRLRVLNVSNFSDGESLADVQDVDSGQKFSIPGRMVGQLKRVVETTASLPPPPAATVVQTPPSKAISKADPIVGQAPPVRPLPTNANVTTTATVPPPPAPVRPPETVPDSLPPVRLPAMATAPPPAMSSPPVAAPTRSATIIWRATGETQAVAPQPTAPQPVPPAVTPAPARRDVWSAVKPTPGVEVKPAVVTPQFQTLPSATTPGLQPKLSPDPVPPTTGAVVRGQAPEPTHGYLHLKPPGAEPSNSAPGYLHLKPQVAEERSSVEQAGYGYPTRQSIEQQMMTETKHHVYDLYTAVRPSLREDAATALAEGRFASRPEVKQVLAKAALADPAPSVRAHCIRLLSALGYHDPEYLEYLRSCVAAGNASVRVSATIALGRLTPR